MGRQRIRCWTPPFAPPPAGGWSHPSQWARRHSRQMTVDWPSNRADRRRSLARAGCGCPNIAIPERGPGRNPPPSAADFARANRECPGYPGYPYVAEAPPPRPRPDAGDPGSRTWGQRRPGETGAEFEERIKRPWEKRPVAVVPAPGRGPGGPGLRHRPGDSVPIPACKLWPGGCPPPGEVTPLPGEGPPDVYGRQPEPTTGTNWLLIGSAAVLGVGLLYWVTKGR